MGVPPTKTSAAELLPTTEGLGPQNSLLTYAEAARAGPASGAAADAGSPATVSVPIGDAASGELLQEPSRDTGAQDGAFTEGGIANVATVSDAGDDDGEVELEAVGTVELYDEKKDLADEWPGKRDAGAGSHVRARSDEVKSSLMSSARWQLVLVIR